MFEEKHLKPVGQNQNYEQTAGEKIRNPSIN